MHPIIWIAIGIVVGGASVFVLILIYAAIANAGSISDRDLVDAWEKNLTKGE
ncbi:MAG: hypothetical protein QMD04_10625 [Anaerolineales bacterium]|nr:hypothetical protein [Anaerolineales bacterium]